MTATILKCPHTAAARRLMRAFIHQKRYDGWHKGISPGRLDFDALYLEMIERQGPPTDREIIRLPQKKGPEESA